MKQDLQLEEEVIAAWVKLTGLLKNTRLSQGMIYNEAIIMLIVNRRYEQDGEGLVSFKEIVAETNMLKSLVNRTIDSLVKKNLLQRCEGKTDRRTTFVRPVKENLHEYLEVHQRTLEMVGQIVEIIGKEDAQAFIRLTEKLSKALLD